MEHGVVEGKGETAANKEEEEEACVVYIFILPEAVKVAEPVRHGQHHREGEEGVEIHQTERRHGVHLSLFY